MYRSLFLKPEKYYFQNKDATILLLIIKVNEKIDKNPNVIVFHFNLLMITWNDSSIAYSCFQLFFENLITFFLFFECRQWHSLYFLVFVWFLIFYLMTWVVRELGLWRQPVATCMNCIWMKFVHINVTWPIFLLEQISFWIK